MARKPTGNPRGRPKKEIDELQFKKLCGLQCTLSEIAGFFDCSEDTIENWCKKNYRAIFSDVYKTMSQNGKIALRRHQFALAEKSATMAIWLGKQLLGQRDIDREEIPDRSAVNLKIMVKDCGGKDERGDNTD